MIKVNKWTLDSIVFEPHMIQNVLKIFNRVSKLQKKIMKLF